jgi:hypothetical protein
MGLLISLQAFQDNNFATFKRSIAWDVFGPRAKPSAEGHGLWYDAIYNGVLCLDDDEDLTGFSLLRPGDGAALDFYKIAQKVPSLLMWNGDCFAVADAAYLAGIPNWMLEGYSPTIAHSGEEFLECLGTIQTSFVGEGGVS